MKVKLAIPSVMVFLVCAQYDACLASTNSPGSIRTNFVKDAILSTQELQDVVKLANLCGLHEVAEVETFHCIPGSDRAIRVASPEKVDGRKVTFQTLEICREGWNYNAGPKLPGSTKTVGQFTSHGPLLEDFHQLTIFATATGIIRIDVQEGIPIDIADKIIKALTSGHAQYSDDFVQHLAMGGPLSVTRSIRASNDYLKDRIHALISSQPEWLSKSFNRDRFDYQLDDQDKTAKQVHYWIGFSKNLNRYEIILTGDDVKFLRVIEVRV